MRPENVHTERVPACSIPSLPVLLKFYAFLVKSVMPFTNLSILVLSIRQVLQGQLLVFMTLFLIFIGTFVVTMLTIYPDHHARGKLPQAHEFVHWFSATHALIMAGFTGEPLDLNLHPDFLNPLGPWQKVCTAAKRLSAPSASHSSLSICLSLSPHLSASLSLSHHKIARHHHTPHTHGRSHTHLSLCRIKDQAHLCSLFPFATQINMAVFFLIYVLYIFLSLILLLNLLIALLGSTFRKTQVPTRHPHA